MTEPNNTVRPVGVDLFAGAGGLSLGFEQAGFEIAAAVELDPIHSAVHQFNFPKSATICGSVTDISGDDIRDRSRIKGRDVDVVFGGPPCQGFSLIGYRALDDPRNHLLAHFVRLVAELSPKTFVLENVSGLTAGSHRLFLKEVIEKFEDLGYDVEHDYKVLDAAHYGIPQHRKRLFLFGARHDVALPAYPAATSCPRTVNGGVDQETLPPTPTVWEAIGDLPEPEEYDELLVRDWIVAKHGTASKYASRLRDPWLDASDYSVKREWNSDLLTSSLRTVHTKESIRRFMRTQPGATESKSRLLKLDPDGLCNTLRAGTPSNRGAFTSPRPIHPFTPRVITVREAARLHSYPDWFRLHTTKWHGFRQIGNSVPPLLARAVAREVMRALGATAKRSRARVRLGNEKLLSFTMGEAAEYFGVDPHVIEPRWRDPEKARAEAGLERPSQLYRARSAKNDRT